MLTQQRVERACKPNPVRRKILLSSPRLRLGLGVLRRTIIHLRPTVARRLKHSTRGFRFPIRRTRVSGERNKRGGPPLAAYLSLLAVGFALPSMSPSTRCALTAPFHPYSPKASGIFSVALSLGSPRVGVTNHCALSSSDFPPGQHAGRVLTGRNRPDSAARPGDRHRPLHHAPVYSRRVIVSNCSPASFLSERNRLTVFPVRRL